MTGVFKTPVILNKLRRIIEKQYQVLEQTYEDSHTNRYYITIFFSFQLLCKKSYIKVGLFKSGRSLYCKC